jgi:hypothetical protein
MRNHQIWNTAFCNSSGSTFQFYVNEVSPAIACNAYYFGASYADDDEPRNVSGLSMIAAFKMSNTCEATGIDTICHEQFIRPGSSWPTFWCHAIQSIAAQTDASGIQRIIRSDGQCSDAQSGDSLWFNSAINGWISAALLPTSPDERIIRHTQTNRFEIFNASNGELLDSTTTIVGTPSYLIRLPDHIAEIVTYDVPTRTVRVYKPIRRVEELTIRYHVNSQQILLDWTEVSGARSYTVYSSPGFGEPESLLGTVYNGVTLFGVSLDPTVRTKTFYVTANY